MPASKTPAFAGRVRERRALDELLARVRGGASGVLVVRGEAGIGKTMLMGYLASEAADCRLARIDGVESEMELPLAALHQLCTPLLGSVDRLPKPQQRALRVAFGMSAEPASDRFVLGLAVLSLLAESADGRPLMCLVDDAQWLDEASAQVLGFVGRRLHAEPIGLVFAVREKGGEKLFGDLPTLTLEGLSDEDAQALLAASVPGSVDERVRSRIVAETGGNPLGLLDLARSMTEAELAGGFAGPRQASLDGRLQSLYLRQVQDLPESARQLLVLAAADPTGDPTLLWSAAQTLRLGADAAAAARAERLLEIGSRVRFRHPLVRSAAYVAASAEDRRTAHRALAAANRTDPERRVWHLAAAADGPDEEVATALERAAAEIQARAGVAASAAFLQRCVTLTEDPRRYVDRALAAALAHLHAGAFDAALSLLARAQAHSVDDLQRARVEMLRAQVASASVTGREAPVLLVQAAETLESLDIELARTAYLHAWLASAVAGPLAGSGGLLPEVSRAARAAPRPTSSPQVRDLLLDGLTTMILHGGAAAESRMRPIIDAFRGDQVADEDRLQWGVLAQVACMSVWDVDSWIMLSARDVEVARATGALAPLFVALNAHGLAVTMCGDFDRAASLAAEKGVVNEVTGIRLAATYDLLLAGYRGRPAAAAPLFAASVQDALERGEGLALQMADWSKAVLNNGLGRYSEAVAAAEPATAEACLPYITQWILPELIEAATRTTQADLAEEGLDRLSAMTNIEGSDWAKGIAARCRGLLAEGPEAERWFVDAIERLSRTPLRLDLARAHLLYGEWLRRVNRRSAARPQLRMAFDQFTTIGAEAFAERARIELAATGEKVRKRVIETSRVLTQQEEHIIRLVQEGRTNREIAAELFLSSRTIEWHLRKVFTKLGVASRRELRGSVPSRPSTSPL
ncbi:ATP-binding protein [Kribbella sp. CA-247076]|uniref:ATP-binding protein n=1 Tax=Kribbella sp. CA-247076 TaxID=3239941 RepID=UPI003D91D9BC